MNIGINFTLGNVLSDFSYDIAKPQPRIEKIHICDYPSAEKVASAWKRIAKEKEKQAVFMDEKIQFKNCAQIVSYIASKLQNPNNASGIYARKDLDGTYQGFMVIRIEQTEVYIEYLVTNPINIRSIVNEQESKKASGVGTHLLHMAEEIAIQEGKTSVYLYPLGAAVGFYERNGFAASLWGPMKKAVKEISLPHFAVA